MHAVTQAVSVYTKEYYFLHNLCPPYNGLPVSGKKVKPAKTAKPCTYTILVLLTWSTEILVSYCTMFRMAKQLYVKFVSALVM